MKMNLKLRTTILVILVAGCVYTNSAMAVQTTRISSTKAITSDVSTDGNATFNTTQSGVFQVNNSPIGLGHWSHPYVGNLTNVSLSAFRTWTLRDETGTIPTIENSNTWGGTQSFTNGPSFTDFSNANHDHQDADDGGTLSLMPVRLTLSDGATVNGYLYVSAANLLQANGTFVAKTNSYLEGAVRANVSLAVGPGAATSLLTGTTTATQDTVFDLTSTAAGAVGNFVEFRARQKDSGGTLRTGTTVRLTQEAAGASSIDSGLSVFVSDAGSLEGQLVITKNGVYVLDALEIDGALNHDGTTVGFYGTAPITQRAGPTSTTDDTGGTASTCEAIAAGALYSQTDMQRVRNCLATLILKLNDLTADIDALGLTS